MRKERIEKWIAIFMSIIICITSIPVNVYSKDSKVRSNPIASSLFENTVLSNGMYLESQRIGAEYLKKFDVDTFAVSLFRYSSEAKKKVAKENGLDLNAGYGGWEASGENGLGGHCYGHYMSACVSMYTVTKDDVFKEKVERGIYWIKLAQDEDGFIGGFSRKNLDAVFENPNGFWAGGNNDAFLNGIWAPWYTIHKILAGLIDAYTYMGIEEALVCAEKIASYAKIGTDKLNDAQMEKMLIGEYGGINESFAQLYEITGKEEYITLAKRFSHKLIMDPLARGENNLPGLHANTQIPKICGAAKIYLITGDEYYKKVAENFWKYVVETQTYANGGTSNYEFFTSLDEEPLSDKNCETCCVYNMLKLTEYICQWDMQGKYMDYYENVLYNQILGSQSAKGQKTYSVDLSMGASTVFLSDSMFECCLGTGFENPARYNRMIYAANQDVFYINLFIPSTVEWKEKQIAFTQTTAYPNQDTVEIAVTEAENIFASLCIRVPEWTENMQIQVNGQSITPVYENGYAKIQRTWSTGDTIQLKIPMKLRLHVSRSDENIVAFKYGAILLAGDLGNKPVRNIITETRNPNELLEKTDGALNFIINEKLQGKNSISLRPFYTFESERHMVYWKLGEPIVSKSFEERVYDVTTDIVTPGHMQSEIDHNYQSDGDSQQGIFSGAASELITGSWRDVRNGYISYEIKVIPDRTNYLLSMFWGSDTFVGTEQRKFDIIIEDRVLYESYLLDNNLPGAIENFYLKIPKELTQGKDKVTVTYRADAGCIAGGVFGIRSMTRPVGNITWEEPVLASSSQIQKVGNWQQDGDNLCTTDANASISYTFTGSHYIRLSARKDALAKPVALYINNEKLSDVTIASNINRNEIIWESALLDEKAIHILELITMGNFAFDHLQVGKESGKIGNVDSFALALKEYVQEEEAFEKENTPTDEPTDTPTDEPTDTPSDEPTDTPSDEPTDIPSDIPKEEDTGTEPPVVSDKGPSVEQVIPNEKKTLKKPKAPKLVFLKFTNKKNAKLKFKGIKGISNYEIYRTGKNMSKKPVYKIKGKKVYRYNGKKYVKSTTARLKGKSYTLTLKNIKKGKYYIRAINVKKGYTSVASAKSNTVKLR